ncbi:MAG: peptidoglycan recognition family protein [Cellulosilyticum sp.]|nr:peptidoglycan recognition family protein [Cellulosilyticum sp.]
MEIKKDLLTPNTYSRPRQKLNKVTKIVVHWVGNANSSAKANRDYFESLRYKRIYASAHYIIGLQGEILQCVPENEVAYHATKANSYSIGIENCHPDWTGKYNDKTYKSLIELCADLCKRYGLNPDTDIIRHYDVTRKMCPKYYVEHPTAWAALKKDVKAKMMEKEEDTELLQALKVLKEKGIILDTNVWGNIETMNMKYAQLMVEKIGKSMGQTTYEDTIQYLVDKKVINTPEAWQNKNFKPEFCKALLIRVSKLIR